MEIGSFGGTFNPPTQAHKKILETCVELPFIDEVWLMPSGQRRDKQFETSDHDRLEMLKLMTGQVAAGKTIKIVDIEMLENGLTRTAETVKLLESTYAYHNFWFVYGVDSYHSMHNWDDGIFLKDNLQMLLVPRAGFGMPKETPRLRHLDIPGIIEMNLSSTDVRKRISEGESIEDMVCHGVASYIADRNLYQQLPAMR